MIGQEMAIYLRRDAKKWEPGWSQDERTGWWKKTDGDGGGWVPIEVIKDALRERMDLFDTDLSTDLITTIARNSEDRTNHFCVSLSWARHKYYMFLVRVEYVYVFVLELNT